MTYIIVVAVAFLASALTFFSGFGLGTLLLPAFALFFAIEQAVALTAIVHFLNGLFKLVLVGRRADLGLVIRFGIPAILASFVGAWLLVWLSDVAPLGTYSVFGRGMSVTPVKLVVGVLLLLFSLAELLPGFRRLSFSPKYLPLGGALSGFFGGLSGMQGALRSAFLAKVDITKEVFIATGAVIATLIDVSRLAVYSRAILSERGQMDYALLTAAALAAFGGALLGNSVLPSMTMQGVRGIVAVMLLVVAIGLIAGVL
jgi:uncharacterized membrane protein YfcA